MINRTIPTLEEMSLSLHEAIKVKGLPVLTVEELDKLKEVYDRVIQMVNRYVPQDSPDINVDVSIGTFRDTGGYQIIFEGAVSDMSRPVKDEYNWHLQNTSRWLFAFGCVFDTERRDFSIHT